MANVLNLVKSTDSSNWVVIFWANADVAQTDSATKNRKRRIIRLPSCLFYSASVFWFQCLIDLRPVDDVPPGTDVVRPAVLIFQVVGVLPDVESEDRLLPFISGLS